MRFERIAQCIEECRTRSRSPSTTYGGLGVRRNFPVGLEASEMVDADNVAEGERSAHTFDPPAIALIRVCGPVVQRVAPMLSCCAEEIRRYASDDARQARPGRADTVRAGPVQAGRDIPSGVPVRPGA